MEASILLPLVLITLWMVTVFFLKKSFPNRVKLPPGTSGWPLFGETIHFSFLGPQKFIDKRMKKYSEDVFQTSLFGEKMAIFCGADGNKFIFTNENRLVTRWLPKSIVNALLFSAESSGQNNFSTRKVSTLRRSFQYDGLRREAIKQYIPAMDQAAREHIEKYWASNQEVKVCPLVKYFTLSLACRIFLNIQDEEQIRKLTKPLDLVSKELLSLPVNLPGFAYNRAIKAGKLLREELMKVIRERKKEVMEENKKAKGQQDRLTQMLLFTDEDGQFMSETEIANNIIGLLLASYDSTSNAVTFVLKHLADLPHIYDEVFKEMMAIAKAKGPDELLNWEDMDKMKYSWNVARESFRVTPPNQGTFRESMVDFTYAGFTIPKGWKIFWNVNTTHKNPKYFPDPEKFDPTRFEGRGPAPYTFVPFGAGPRMCPGREYAKLETLVFMYNVVKRFKLERAIPNEKIVYRSSLVPVNGLPIRLQPHGN